MGRYVTVETEVDIDILDVIDNLGERDLEQVRKHIQQQYSADVSVRELVDNLKLASARRDLPGFLSAAERIADRAGVILDTSKLLTAA